jgi:hypothetical protein
MNAPAAAIIGDDEVAARFIVFRSWVRSDGTVRPEAFMPHPYPDLSVTRHIGLQKDEIWHIGDTIVQKQNKPLHGRADLIAGQIRNINLAIGPDPLPENPNHSIITGWAAEKHLQKDKALEIHSTFFAR